MNIGIRLHDTRPGTMKERLAYAREQGFSCVQLAMGKAVPGFRMQDAPTLLTGKLAEEVRKELDGAGLECAVLGCYLNLTSRDAEEAAHTQEIYRSHLRFAKWIGARCVGTETPSVLGDGKACRTEEEYQLFLQRVRPLVEEAEKLKVVLAIEPVCSHVLYDAALAQRMLDDLGSNQVRIILDAVNLLESEQLPTAEAVIEDAIERLGDQTCVLHMKDYLPAPEKFRPDSVPCGQGGMRYDALLDLARAKDLPMTLEDTTPENAEETRRYLESLCARKG